MALDTSKIFPLGFGCMRFNGRETNEIDLVATAQMVDAFMEVGGNYFDTAWAYPNSEKALGAALVKRHPRESFMIASKCVAWMKRDEPTDLEAQLQESLADLGTEYLDVYLMHNMGGRRTVSFDAVDGWEFMKSAKERGLVKHIGFSAHCTPEELEELIAKYPEAELAQLQVNYQDWDDPSFRERECLEVARKHGLPVIAMEPIKGGLLADPPAAVKEILDAELPKDSYATAALRFAASAPGVCVTLSGMNAMQQVIDNCKVFEEFEPMGEGELATFAKIQEALRGNETIPCTGCDYCAKVCPQGIGISGTMTALNYYINYGDAKMAKGQMGFIVGFTGGKKLVTECISCGVCESACPQNINILECFDRVKAEILPAELDKGGGAIRK